MKTISLSVLKENKDNPRFIDNEKIEKLKSSLKEFPKMLKLRPIVVDKNNTIIGGNMRYRALKELGYKEIPEEWVRKASEFTKNEIKRFTITDNMNYGQWDWEVLKAEWDTETLENWGMEIYDYGEIQDIEIVENFNETVKFLVKCQNIAELEKLKTKLNTKYDSIEYHNLVRFLK